MSVPGGDGTESGWAAPTGVGYGNIPLDGSAAPDRWRSLRGLRTALTVLLWLAVPAYVLFAGALAARVNALEDWKNGTSLQELLDFSDADDFVGVMAIVTGLLTLAIAVCFIVWMWRAAKNNEALGRRNARFSPGWSIGAWFIPLANLIIPVLILQDLWRGSNLQVPRGHPEWRQAHGSGLVGTWWGLHIVASMRFVTGTDNESLLTRDGIDEFQAFDAVGVLGSLLAVPAAVLAVFLVRRITDRQEACLLAQRAAWASEMGRTAPQIPAQTSEHVPAGLGA